MKKKNFICPITKKEFYVSRYVIIAGVGGPVFREGNIKGKRIVNPENNEPLQLIVKEGPIESPLVMGSTQDRMKRNQAYFKSRAKKHAQSDEQQYFKKQATNRELKSYKNKAE